MRTRCCRSAAPKPPRNNNQLPRRATGHRVRAGTLLWHSDGGRLVKPFVVAGHVYARRGVKRHSLVDVFDLHSGKVTASVFEPGIGITPLTGVIDSIGA